MSAPQILNFAAFQVGWFACVLGAAQGRPWLGPAIALPILAFHLARDRKARGAEASLIVVVAALGFVMNSSLCAAGVLRYEGRVVPWLCPPWIVALWALFAMTFHHSFRWLLGRPLLAALLGGVGGPLSYLAGARLGALEFGEPRSQSLWICALVWAIALPSLMKLAEACRARALADSARPERRRFAATIGSSALALAAIVPLSSCASRDKAEIERALLDLTKNAPIRAQGLERATFTVDTAEGESRPMEVTYFHAPRRGGAEPAAAERMPVVLVHGTPSSLMTWSELVFGDESFAGLCDDYDVWAINVVGHGTTRTESSPYSFQVCADFVAGAIRALGLSGVCLVGNSYGGEFCWRVALDHPDLVDRLVLLDSSGYPRPEGGFLPEEVAMREISLASYGYLLNSRERIETALAPHFGEPVDPERIEEIFRVCGNADNWGAMVDLARDENGDRADELGRLSAPTLLIWGDRDAAYPIEQYARRFAEDLPDARLAIVEECGHYPQEERPARTASLIREFLGAAER